MSNVVKWLGESTGDGYQNRVGRSIMAIILVTDQISFSLLSATTRFSTNWGRETHMGRRVVSVLAIIQSHEDPS